MSRFASSARTTWHTSKPDLRGIITSSSTKCSDQLARHRLVDAPLLDKQAQTLHRADRAHVVLQRQRAHAVHDREGAELLQVERLLVAVRGDEPAPPASGLGELVGRAGEA